MAAVLHSYQSELPVTLFDHLYHVRHRYARALRGAATGDFTQAKELRSVSRYVGHLLADEARKSLAERGGVNLVEISIAVDRYLPELRRWNHYVALEGHQRLLAGSGHSS
jgi:hypothetical protein